jgi:hypothetical protein
MSRPAPWCGAIILVAGVAGWVALALVVAGWAQQLG